MLKTKIISFITAAAMCLSLIMLPQTVMADGKSASVTTSEGTTTEYDTLGAAVDAANAGDTVTLLSDVTIGDNDYNYEAYKMLLIRKAITLDLDEHTLSIDNGNIYGVYITTDSEARVTIKNGTIDDVTSGVSHNRTVFLQEGNLETENLTIITRNPQDANQYSYCIFAASSQWESKVILGEGTKLIEAARDGEEDPTVNHEQDYYGVVGVAIFGHNKTADWKALEDKSRAERSALTISDGVTIDVNEFAVSTNGAYHPVDITINGGKLTANMSTGVYFPGDGILNINGGEITGQAVGVEIRAGTLNMTDGSVTALSAPTQSQANGNGTSVDGAAIAVSQHTTNLDISVNISGGTLTGFIPLYEEDLQDELTDNISLSVTGGAFICRGEAEEGSQAVSQPIYSENIVNFVSGGTFSAAPEADYLVEGCKATQNGNKFEVSHELAVGDYVQIGNFNGKPMVYRVVAFQQIINDYTDDNARADDKPTYTKYANPTTTESESETLSFDNVGFSTEYKDGYYPLLLYCGTSEEVKQNDGYGYTVTVGPYAPKGTYPNSDENRENKGSNYWETSSLKAFLNSEEETVTYDVTYTDAPEYKNSNNAGFLTNFSTAEKEAMITDVTQRTVVSSAYATDSSNPESDGGNAAHTYGYSVEDSLRNYNTTAYYKNTTDTVFVLDIPQMMQTKSNFTDLYHHKSGWTWLRNAGESPAGNSYGARQVGPKATNNAGTSAAYQIAHVRPAFFLNPDALSDTDNVITASYTETIGETSKNYIWYTFKTSVEAAEISEIAEQIYNGSAIEPEFTVTYNGEELTENIDYTVSYSDNINAGTATVTVTGIGNYIGTVSKTFEIEKANGTASVTMSDYNCGETTAEPVPVSETNGTENVTYQYKLTSEDEEMYSNTKPSVAGEYTVKAVFAETANYNEVTATNTFTVSHIEVTDEAVAPTCTETGLTEGKHCSGCNAVLAAQETVAATDHDYGVWEITTEPTEETSGMAQRICQNDSSHIDSITLPVLTDTEVWTESGYTAPTEEADGSREYTSQYGKVTVIIPRLTPATDAPATDAPATDAPATDAPATDTPATDAPATDAPATDTPATDAPATDTPATDTPATDAPATDTPATAEPAATAIPVEKTKTSITVSEPVIGYNYVLKDKNGNIVAEIAPTADNLEVTFDNLTKGTTYTLEVTNPATNEVVSAASVKTKSSTSSGGGGSASVSTPKPTASPSATANPAAAEPSATAAPEATALPADKNSFILTIGKKEASVWGEEKVNDVAPVIVNDRTMLPARFVAESLGAKVEWNQEEQKVTITKDDTVIIITIGAETALVNGEEQKLDSPAYVTDDTYRTYTPVRFISENLGYNVEWNQDTKQVIITKNPF